MSKVLTIVDYNNVFYDQIQKVSDFIQDGKVEVIKENMVTDIFFENKSIDEVKEFMLPLSMEYKIDFAAQEANTRKKKLIICDLESTIMKEEIVDELAEEIGIKDEIAKITEQGMLGEITFIESVKSRVKLLKGIKVSLIDDIMKRITFSEGAVELIETMKENKAITILATGGFKYFGEPIKEKFGFDILDANEIIIKDGLLTGELKLPIKCQEDKKNILIKTAEKNNISLEECIAIGDGANDIGMIEKAGLGISFCGRDILKEKANGIIESGNLKSCLYFMGLK